MTGTTIRSVPWDAPDAARLRAAMQDEMEARYRDMPLPSGLTLRSLETALTIDPGQVAWTAVAYASGNAVGHVALCHVADELELKRMYVVPDHRGSGVARLLLRAAEQAARAQGAARLALQTGPRQQDAIRLYEREGYRRIPLLPPYRQLTFSTCMAKNLT